LALIIVVIAMTSSNAELTKIPKLDSSDREPLLTGERCPKSDFRHQQASGVLYRSTGRSRGS